MDPNSDGLLEIAFGYVVLDYTLIHYFDLPAFNLQFQIVEKRISDGFSNCTFKVEILVLWFLG